MAVTLLNLNQFSNFFHSLTYHPVQVPGTSASQKTLYILVLYSRLFICFPSEILPHLKCLDTLSCNIFLFKKCGVQALYEANHYIDLLKIKLLKNICPVFLSSFVSLIKDTYCGHTKRNACSDQIYTPEAIKKKDVTAKCLCTRLTFTQSLTVSADNYASLISLILRVKIILTS